MGNPRIVGGSNYDNPYAHPVDFMPKTPQQKLQDKIFDAFDPNRQLKQEEIKEDPIAEIKAEFIEAQRRNAAARPRGATNYEGTEPRRR